MNISKINPVGYETKTENGNTYKHSNIFKTAGLAGAAAINIAAETHKNNLFLALMSSSSAFRTLEKEYKITVPKALQPVVVAAGFLLDLTFGYVAGKWIDNAINKKRAQKADEKV